MVLDEVIELRALKGEFHVMSREWTLDFRRENYTFGLLFPELRPDSDVRLFSSNMVYEYIPKRAKSVRFTMRGTNLYNAPIQVNDYTEKWQQLDAFSGQASGTDSLFFCGGPVVALDWLPLAEGQTKEHQILAVVCKNDFDEFYLADRIQPSKCLIQIWDIGYLNNNRFAIPYSLVFTIFSQLYAITATRKRTRIMYLNCYILLRAISVPSGH